MDDRQHLQGCGNFRRQHDFAAGIHMLLQDAQRQQFDVVLAEALDRISRDQADVATLFKHLRFAG